MLALPFPPSVERRLSGTPLVLLLDVDGTLAPIAPRPNVATVPLETRRVVSALAAQPGVHVVVISGRAAADAARVVGVDDVWIIGNHGLEVAAPRSMAEPQDGVAAFGESIADAALRVDAIIDRYPGAFVEDKRWTFSVHYRLADRTFVPALLADVTAIARDAGLRVTQGKRVIEVRPPLDIDKGTASVALAQQLGAFAPDASLFCAGDDRTDEDAFVALRRARADFVTACVCGDDEPENVDTHAEFRVADPEALRGILEAILDQRRSRAS